MNKLKVYTNSPLPLYRYSKRETLYIKDDDKWVKMIQKKKIKMQLRRL